MRRTFHLLGSALGVAGAAFIVWQLLASWQAAPPERLEASTWLAVAMIAIGFGAANLMLASGWWHALAHTGVRVRKGWAIQVYGVSQMAKYVPGNVFHLAGRQAFGMAANLPALAFARSMAWELAAVALTGTLFLLLLVPLFYDGWSTWQSIVAFATAALLLVRLSRWAVSAAISAMLRWHVLYLVASGAAFALLSALVAPGDYSLGAMVGVAGAYVVAWLLGLIVPGAPAGAGIREVALLQLLDAHFARPELLLLIVLARVATVAGDLLYFIAASRLPYWRLEHG